MTLLDIARFLELLPGAVLGTSEQSDRPSEKYCPLLECLSLDPALDLAEELPQGFASNIIADAIASVKH